MLTKKHFNQFATIIKDTETKEQIISELIRYFKTENPNFNSDKFRQACSK